MHRLRELESSVVRLAASHSTLSLFRTEYTRKYKLQKSRPLLSIWHMNEMIFGIHVYVTANVIDHCVLCVLWNAIYRTHIQTAISKTDNKRRILKRLVTLTCSPSFSLSRSLSLCLSLSLTDCLSLSLSRCGSHIQLQMNLCNKPFGSVSVLADNRTTIVGKIRLAPYTAHTLQYFRCATLLSPFTYRRMQEKSFLIGIWFPAIYGAHTQWKNGQCGCDSIECVARARARVRYAAVSLPKYDHLDECTSYNWIEIKRTIKYSAHVCTVYLTDGRTKKVAFFCACTFRRNSRCGCRCLALFNCGERLAAAVFVCFFVSTYIYWPNVFTCVCAYFCVFVRELLALPAICSHWWRIYKRYAVGCCVSPSVWLEHTWLGGPVEASVCASERVCKSVWPRASVRLSLCEYVLVFE